MMARTCPICEKPTVPLLGVAHASHLWYARCRNCSAKIVQKNDAMWTVVLIVGSNFCLGGALFAGSRLGFEAAAATGFGLLVLGILLNAAVVDLEGFRDPK
jgi:prepilin signal peptidase PulO-like enzyme (type II secretory pathway)